MLTFAVDISVIRISVSAPIIGYAANTIPNITCSATIRSPPSPLPQDATVTWLFSPDSISNLSLPSGVIVSNEIANSNNFTSSLQFSPLLPSHAGMYVCQFGSSEGLQRTAEISVINNCESSVKLMHSLPHDVSIIFSRYDDWFCAK
jgi:hypothetical protein